jgi:hypothetical protein
MGANGGAIDAVVAGVCHDFGERHGNGLPDPGLTPSAEPAIDGVPTAIFSRNVTSRCTAAKPPEDAVDDGAVLLRASATPTVFGLDGKQTLQNAPLRFGKIAPAQACLQKAAFESRSSHDVNQISMQRIASCDRARGGYSSCMKHSSLVAFLNGDLSPEAFGRQISNEVNACEHRCNTDGMGYIMAPDGPTQVITRDQARRLLAAMLSDQLVFVEANYTADCLIMSDNLEFADEAVAEAIAFVADDSRPPTNDETKAVIAALS